MAAHGSPDSHWPVYGKDTHTAMVFGVPDPSPLPAAPRENVRTAKCDFWDRQFEKVLAMYRPPDSPPSRVGSAGDAIVGNKF